MKLKKIFSLCLAGLLALSVTGCVNQHPEETSSANESGEVRLVATSPAVAQICNRLNLDLVGICQSTSELPERYDGVTTVGMAMNPDLEIIKSLDPDYILSPSSLQNDLQPKYASIGVSSLFLNLKSVEGMYASIEGLGEKFGREEEAAVMLEEFDSFMTEFAEKNAGKESPKVLVLMGLPGSYIIATDNSYVGSLVKLAGGTNVYGDGDGQEFLFNNGHGYYSAKRFFRKMFGRAKELGVPYIRFSGATLSEGSWHYQSVWNVGGGRNLYDIDTREWGSATSQGKDLRDVTYSNYYPVSFGGNFAIKDTSTVEQYEHVQAISVGYGATYFLAINQKDVESCPQKDQIFAAIRTWEDARHANAFPRAIKKLLRDPSYDWRLEAGADGNSWTLHRLVDGKSVETFDLKRAKGY